MRREHWDWLKKFEASQVYNPYIQQIKLLAKKGDKAKVAGELRKASEIYLECSQIAAKANLLEHELIYAYLSNGLSSIILTKSSQLDIAIEIIIKAQKLDIENFPWYPMFQYHLAIIYTQLDLFSYANEIREIYDIVENYAHYRLDLMCKVQVARASIAFQLHQFEKAQHYATLAAEVNPDDDYHHTSACDMNALVHYRKADFVTALRWFIAREYHAKKSNQLPTAVIDSVFQQGVCLLYLNRTDEAEERFAQCKNLEDVYKLKVSRWTSYSLHIAKREYNIVLDALNEDISQSKAEPSNQFIFILGKAVMLNMMGQSISEILDHARDVAQNFKKPENYDIWINAVANGDTLSYNWHKIDHNENS